MTSEFPWREDLQLQTSVLTGAPKTIAALGFPETCSHPNILTSSVLTPQRTHGPKCLPQQTAGVGHRLTPGALRRALCPSDGTVLFLIRNPEPFWVIPPPPPRSSSEEAVRPSLSSLLLGVSGWFSRPSTTQTPPDSQRRHKNLPPSHNKRGPRVRSSPPGRPPRLGSPCPAVPLPASGPRPFTHCPAFYVHEDECVASPPASKVTRSDREHELSRE